MSDAPDPFTPLPRAFFERPADRVARDLLGRYLVRERDGGRTVVRLVETEAYLGATDRASHAWAGRRTARNESLYGPPGTFYVYLIYGLHHCLNIVAQGPESGGAVLFRAGEILEDRDWVTANRGLKRPPRPGDLAGGPGKLCHGLSIDRTFDGHDLDAGPLSLRHGEPFAPKTIAAGPRIGIDYAGDAAAWPLRFAPKGHPEMSRPRL